MSKNVKITLIVCVVVGILFCLNSPTDFPVGSIVKIEQGKSLRAVSLQLSKEHVIRSRFLFEAFMILFNREKRVVSTDYYFDSKLPVYEIARRIAHGENHIAPIVVTIPEGFSNAQIADTVSLKLPNFNKVNFLVADLSKQGYLFPDTYYFLIDDTESDVINVMSQNYEKKLIPIRPKIVTSGKTENQIISMASIIEKEAKGSKGNVGGQTDREVISGILWKRISLGIALQVDAAPDTYKNKGLPKNPISNPGVAAILAATLPQSSPYLYYLHDKNGNIHYAKTFAEHEKNIKLYLNN